MIQSVIYIRVAAQAPVTYAVPLLERLKELKQGITTFEFDNFSEESIRQYGIELLKQSEQAAVVLAIEAPDAPISGLTTFFNRMLKAKPPRLLMAMQGEQPLLQKMMQGLGGENFYHNPSEEELLGLLQKLFS